MGLVARVGSPVDCQSTALNECLSTRLVVASIWPFVGMYPIMPLKVGLSVKALSKIVVVSNGNILDLAPDNRSR